MKGVNTMIAATLLIAITVAAATLFSGWATSLTSQQTQTVGNKTKTAVDCTNARLTIDSVYLDFAANKSRVSVKNSGFLDDVITSAAVVNAAGSSARNLTAFPVKLLKGNSVSIEMNITGIMSVCSNFSQAIVSTQCTSKIFDGTPKNC